MDFGIRWWLIRVHEVRTIGLYKELSLEPGFLPKGEILIKRNQSTVLPSYLLSVHCYNYPQANSFFSGWKGFLFPVLNI